ncbi:helix-turn-helix transcriptional regulator [Streptomyces xiamenensis]|uniref:helix-turn-helix transcriptional regulator n=1 Tax=Streptomyces xiamenensis TaxID=408015 RepID=UPI001FE53279|nr:helix-turn-helix domain-containing protein [Streptomyces xiamenensis]
MRKFTRGSNVVTLAHLAGLLGRDGEQGSPDGPGDLLHQGWYTTEEVAALIGVDASTLRRWRTVSPLQGPPFVRLTSRTTVYSAPDVEAWLASRRIVPDVAA